MQGSIDVETLTIATARSHLLRVPVPPLRVDAQSVLDSWDVLAVEIRTESGLCGWGYQCGFGAAMVALRNFVDGAILPELVGRDARRHREWWSELYLLRHHIGLNGPAIQGLSAPEVAAWDLLARAADVPLWSLLGGEAGRRIPCYDTNCGWLGYSLDELLENVSRSLDCGFRGVKVKIGIDFDEDLQRLAALRSRFGTEVLIATDANNRWDRQTALQRAPARVGGAALSFRCARPCRTSGEHHHATLTRRKPLRAADDSRYAGSWRTGYRPAVRYEIGRSFPVDGSGGVGASG